jgi:electron transfer flavoprotein alpha subunit
MARIWVYAELGRSGPQPISLELLSLARELGEVAAIALGPGACAAAGTLGRYGAGKVYAGEEDVFSEYLAEPATDTMAALVEQHRPDLILFGFTPDSREVAGRLAARLGVGLISNAVEVAVDGEAVRAKVPYFGGSQVATFRANARPAIVLVRPKSHEATEAGGEAEVEQIEPVVAEGSKRARITERKVESGDQIKLEEAGVVVSGGRGLASPDNFRLVEELAQALGGAAGATRAIVDAGWVPYALQVGQTGKTVGPGVYIAAGISGAMQHTVGMKASKVIIAINKDADAPIMRMADLGVVGDVLKILPRLTEAVKARKNR